MKKINELREMSATELQNELFEMRKQQFNLRFKKSNGSLDKPDTLTLVRRTIARIKTIMTEKAGSHGE